MAATLSSIDAAIMAALTPLQCPDGGIVADSRPFAYVGHWCGEITRERGVDPEALAQFPCALLHWPGEKNSNGGDLTTMDGDGEDAAQSDWVVYVGVEDVRGAESLVVGASGVPGALALSDLVIGALDGLLIDGLLRSGRLYYTGAAPFVVARGKWYVAALTFFAKRSPDRVAPPDDTVPLLGIDGDVNLVETCGGDDPGNPVDQFVSDTVEQALVTVSGVVLDNEGGSPVAGVLVEAITSIPNPDPVTTGTDGRWSFQVDPNAVQTFRATSPGSVVELTSVLCAEAPIDDVEFWLVPVATLAVLYAALGLTPDPSAGTILAQFIRPDAGVIPSGFGLTFSPPTGYETKFSATLGSAVLSDATITPTPWLGVALAPVGIVDAAPTGITGYDVATIDGSPSVQVQAGALTLARVAATPGVTLSGTVYDIGDTIAPIAGVTVSILGESTTTVTDVNGEWTLPTSGHRDVTVRYAFAGMRTTQTTLTLAGSAISGITAYTITDAVYAQVLAALSVTEDTGDGAVLALYAPFDTAPAGFGATLAPSSGTWIAPTTPALSTTTPADSGLLLVANVTPGTVAMTPTAPGGSTVARAPHVAASQVVTAAVMTFLPCDWT